VTSRGAFREVPPRSQDLVIDMKLEMKGGTFNSRPALVNM